MTSILAKMVSKRLLKEGALNNFGMEDPYFETVPATRLDGKPSTSGRVKKRRKALPLGISQHDGKVLTKVKRRAYRLDMGLFNCCGLKFGWGSVIGIVPGFGDIGDCLLAMMVFRTAQQVEGGLPANIRAMMMMNIIIDFAIGLVPFLGDLADAVFKANTRNAVLLEQHLRKKGAAALKAQGQATPPYDPSSPIDFDRHIQEIDEGLSAAAANDSIAMPKPTHAPEKNATATASRGNSFWGKKKQPDLEQGTSRPQNQPSAPNTSASRKDIP